MNLIKGRSDPIALPGVVFKTALLYTQRFGYKGFMRCEAGEGFTPDEGSIAKTYTAAETQTQWHTQAENKAKV